MAATGIGGIDIRVNDGKLAIRAVMYDATATIVTTGTMTMSLYELQDDGTLKSYDFNDNTFKTTTLTTETVNMTHRTGNNGATNTGIWTYVLSTVTGFTTGGIYLARVSHVQASPVVQVTEFQFGGGVPADLIQVDGTDLSSATLTLKKLVVSNNSGNAVEFTSTGSNGKGLDITGHGTGAGFHVKGGSTGDGFHIESGTTGTYGMYVYSQNGTGMHIAGDGGHGLYIYGGDSLTSDFHGLLIEAYGIDASYAIKLLSTNSAGVYIEPATGRACITGNTGPLLEGDLYGSVLGNVIDAYSVFAGVGVQSNTIQVAGVDIKAKGTVTTGSTSTVIKTTSFSPAGSVVNQFMGRSLYFASDTTTAALRGLVCRITASTNAANPDLTVEMADSTALPATPASGDTFVIC